MRRLHRITRRAAAAWPVLLVTAATLAGGLLALTSYHADHDLSVGTIRLSVEPLHDGALDIYVPLVDWGARFDAVSLPARLRIEARTVDGGAVARVAAGRVDVAGVREQARDGVASYIRTLILIVAVAAVAAGGLVAAALRGVSRHRLRGLLATAVVAGLATVAAVGLLLPPRGELENPEFYANGSQIPVALQATQRATESAQAISQDLDEQLVELAKLISIPSERGPSRALPRLTLASDLHNNVLALPALDRAANGGPMFFAGDLATSGIPLESLLLREVVSAGNPFVFVSGNHDSDTLVRDLAREGAIVLSERGRILPEGRRGDTVVRVAGLRVAGYSDPFERRRADGYRAREKPEVTPALQRRFTRWLLPLVGQIDVVMVHAPALVEDALSQLAEDPPARPLTFLVGHTHEQELRRQEGVVVLNGGTIGGGGAGNFHENQPFGLAVLTYERTPFEPLAADLVRINPRDGSANAERRLLGAG
ncbi:MAG: metallophosphoesterase family protein [Solirubrobacterales bacterium]